MISKNIDFYREKENIQLVVANISGEANINYGEINDKLYFSIFETGSIKKIQGEPKGKNKSNFFLNSGEPEKNSIPFSFKKDKILVLTCSLSFLGHVYEEEIEEDSFKPIQIAPVYVTPYQFLGVEDCFFQEKDKKDINNFYITEKDLSKFKRNGEQVLSGDGAGCCSNKIDLKSTDILEPICLPCPKYTYDIDIPIYGDIQYIKGPLSFTALGPHMTKDSCFFSGTVGYTPLGSGCDCVILKNDIENPPKFTTYINVNYNPQSFVDPPLS
jgi:hypothetical protein